MSDLPAYERDPYGTSLEATILKTGEAKGQSFVVLDDTLFYPEGGGQPSDRGTMNGVAVLDVQKINGEIRHVLAQPLTASKVSLKLDWPRRFDHMQQHTGQHLLTAIAQDRFGWATTAFHLGEMVSDVELAVPGLSSQQLMELEEAISVEIRAARPVMAKWVDPERYGTLKVRSRGLPEGHAGDIRLVEIAGLDLNTCGGTHLKCTAELECIKLLGSESMRGGTRLFFVVGRRVRVRLDAHERRTGAVRKLLGCSDDELVSVLEIKLDQLKHAERRARLAEDELGDRLVADLAAQSANLVEHHFENRDAAFLQKTLRQLLAASPSKLAFFTADFQGQCFFALGAGEMNSVDVSALGRELASLLSAKGGGSGKFYQGKADRLSKRHVVLERLESIQ